MSDDPTQQDGERKGPPKPPPAPAGDRPMSATRMRMEAARRAREQGLEPEPAAAPRREAAPAAPKPAPAPAAAGESNGPDSASKPSAAAQATPSAQPAEAAAPAAAAPPAAPEPPSDPEEIVSLQELLPDLQWKQVYGYLELTVPKASLLEVAKRLRDELGYDYLSAVTAVDWPGRIEMVYHLYSFNYLRRPTGVVLRVDLERPELPEYPLCPSLTALWPGADFQEREVYDLMGVKFVGHPDLRRILLTDDFPGHPLRKDFKFDYEYVLVRHLSYGVEGQLPAENRGARSPN